ncbi:MAG: hypothetical protein F4Z51_08660 [Chloroflexi bacterium]|nr:hypothetical protein [Chloroflexota bacterium]MYD16904.1 hypothetical protein [Chloroflexota bacterium]MYH07379.1 hypothetical protein [Rhodothermaceae bacterium]MYJ00778.1 hypothetical protein [Chloroflexota bacterium]
MATPITEKVYFTITVQSFNRGDHWATECDETSVFTYGDTREESESLNGKAHVAMVQRAKSQGLAALNQFMKSAGISYRIGGDDLAPKSAAETTIMKLGEDYLHCELDQAA